MDARPPTETPASSPLKRVKSESAPGHAVLRIKKRTRGWEPVPRALITDVRLQFDTRGFAAWLLAKPPGWEIRAGALPYLLKKERGPGEHIGRDKVRRFFRELEAAGYVTRRRMRRADGQWRWQIEFTDTPPMTPTHPGTVDGSAVDGSATGGAAVDGSHVDLLQTLNHPKLDQCKPTTTAARQYDTAFGARAAIPATRIAFAACPSTAYRNYLPPAQGICGKQCSMRSMPCTKLGRCAVRLVCSACWLGRQGSVSSRRTIRCELIGLAR